MPRHLQATPSGDGLRIGVALARFNQSVTDLLLAGALAALARHGVADDAIDVATVPGAFELPLCAQRLAATGRYDALVCLGAVVRGETPHFDAEGDVQAFARELVDGVAAHRERIDALIAASAEHWRLPRLSRVDLSLLRLATFELLARADIPASVTIDEAIEIARRFGSEDSPAFVNGVLDHIAQVLGVKERQRGTD